jgi:hypothetical protein
VLLTKGDAAMKYMLLIYSPESAWTPDEWQACAEESTRLCHELVERGVFRTASPLEPVATATSVRVRDGRATVTKGPFAETTEQLGGFYLVDMPNLDEAISFAARLPPAKKGTVEVRPLYKLEGLPQEQLNLAPPADAPDAKRYLLLCYDDEQAWKALGEDALHAAMAEATKLTYDMAAKGRYMSASPLEPVSTATSVRVRQGKRVVTDGPFAETREFLGGFFMIYAKDLDEAVEYAKRHPGARVGTTEVRRLRDLPNVPHASPEVVATAVGT